MLAELRSVSVEAQQLARSVKQEAPQDAFILCAPEARETMKRREWIPYLTWRATVYTPIPASENRRAVRDKRQLFSLTDRSDAEDWIAASGFQAFLLHANPEGSFTLSRARFK
jgi:hypothetical protein